MIKMFCQPGGVNVNALDCQGRYALHKLARNGSEIVTPSQLFEDDFTNERLEWLYECPLREIIEARANVNQQDELGKRALHYAVQNHELVMVKILYEYGVNTLIEDNEGIRTSKTNGLTSMAPHTLEFKVLMREVE